MKCSAVESGEGNWIDVQKDPITDPGKNSKAGCVTLWKSGGEYVSAVNKPTGWHDKAIGEFVDVLETVYCDGKLVKEMSFEEIRANAKR